MEEPPQDHSPDHPSKSARKREMHRLQTLGEQLVKLHPEALASIPMSEQLRSGIEEYQRLKSREALRRHLQFIGRLMRDEDASAIAEALEQARSGGLEERRRLHLAEGWRDRLLEQGDTALEEFLDQHPQADRQHLRRLLRTAAQERAHDKPPASARKLFRYLRDTLFG